MCSTSAKSSWLQALLLTEHSIPGTAGRNISYICLYTQIKLFIQDTRVQYLAEDQENEMLNELFKSMQHNMSDTARCMFLNQLSPLTEGEEYQTRQREGGGGVPKGGVLKRGSSHPSLLLAIACTFSQ